MATIVDTCPFFKKEIDEYLKAVKKAHRVFNSIPDEELTDRRGRTIRVCAANQVKWCVQWKESVDRLRGAPGADLTEGQELGSYLIWKMRQPPFGSSNLGETLPQLSLTTISCVTLHVTLVRSLLA